MRIVHLLIGTGAGGGQEIAVRLARAARARGDTVSFVAPQPGPVAERLREERFELEYADVNRTFRVAGALRLRRLAAGADVLHTHTLAAANVLSRIASPAPVVAHLHIENYFRRATEPIVRRLDAWTARRCARLIAVSKDTRRAYERQGYPKGRIEVVYNGVALDAVSPDGVRNELGVPGNAPLVGEVGRLCDVKGQRELIEALGAVPDARLVLVGADLETGGAYRTRLELEADRVGVRDRIVFAGHRDDARRIVAALDVLVLPSWTEGLPIAVLEAMAERLPVIATPVGGTPEVVVDGETGLLVPPRDSRALAAALRTLLADSDLRQRMGEAGYRRATERFSESAMTGRVLEIYDEIAGR